jgi:hypothetical protein
MVKNRSGVKEGVAKMEEVNIKEKINAHHHTRHRQMFSNNENLQKD